MTANDLRQQLITTLTASTNLPRRFWDEMITRIVAHSPTPNEPSNWSVVTRCGHRKAPTIRQPMNEAIIALRNEHPFVEPNGSHAKRAAAYKLAVRPAQR